MKLFQRTGFFFKVKKFSVKCYSMVCETACEICVKAGGFFFI